MAASFVSNFSKTRVLCLLIALIALTAAAGYADSKAAILVTQVEGKASKSAGSSWANLNLLDELPTGSKIRIQDKSKIKVTFYSDTHAEEVAGPAVVRVEAKSLVLETGGKTQLVAHNAYKGIKSINSIKVAGEKYGGTSMRSVAVKMTGIKILSPRGLIIDKKPSFTWESDSKSGKFTITLEDDSQNQIFRQTAEGLKLDYPSDAAPLEPGKIYIWTITPGEEVMGIEKTGAAIKLPETQTYEMLTSFTKEAEARLKSNPEDTSPLVELMVVYLDFGLIADARKICTRLTRLKPNDENLKIWNSRLSEN
ncbi:MAG: hypothetical protein LWY06_01100 [Firmicutes bacterium]|nr:hypothetical protein [Bacillota bacterium]